MKKLLCAFLALSMMAMSMAGCTKAPPASQAAPSTATPPAATTDTKEKVSIRFMFWNKEESVQELLKLIREKLPYIDLEFQFVDIASYQTVYKTQMNAGEGPDLLSIEKVSTEAQAGYCMDITDQPFMKQYQESVLNELSYEGKSYCAPGPSWFGGYFYNKQMFEDNNWAIPKTYDEWLDLCDAIQAKGIKPIANPSKNPNYLMHYAIGFVNGEFLRQPEGMNWDKDFAAGKVKMADTWGPYLEKWAEVVKRGHITANDLGVDGDQAMDEFVTGKAAMMDSGPWDVETIYGKNPQMKIDMMPYVGNKGGTGWLFGGPGIRFGVNAKLSEPGNEKKLAAVLAILDLITTPEGQQAYWENNKGGSSYVKGVELAMTKEFDGVKDVFAKGNVYAPFMQWNSGVFEEFGKQLQGYVAGDVTLQQVMEATDAKNAEVMAKQP